ncbi:GNAT family N-acetyltransferase [Roseateles sp. NT4]|uniref:GNAT family N-acetyltransferase n=1 Tax=Roseateles sp. NT4 TaxID=3453715 RepID=UPI003EEF9DCA
MIDIIAFTEGYSDDVASLILPIQRHEFGLPITRADQPDLTNIAAFYQRDAGNFWLAMDGADVVGTIALLDIGNGAAALRKMFVSPPFRGRKPGVAAQLLSTLITWSRNRGLRCIYLGTAAQFHAAHRFYEKNGFQEIKPTALPQSFPRMAVDSKFYLKGL